MKRPHRNYNCGTSSRWNYETKRASPETGQLNYPTALKQQEEEMDDHPHLKRKTGHKRSHPMKKQERSEN
jgi:hypothetical protein